MQKSIKVLFLLEKVTKSFTPVRLNQKKCQFIKGQSFNSLQRSELIIK